MKVWFFLSKIISSLWGGKLKCKRAMEQYLDSVCRIVLSLKEIETERVNTHVCKREFYNN